MHRLLLAAAMLALGAAAAFASSFVCCDRCRISVDSRDNNQMRIARRSSFCQMGPPTSTRSGAQDVARRNSGAEGRSCSCR